MTPIPPETYARQLARANYRLALAGRLPAEALVWPYRRRIVGVLAREGWTDAQMAAHTKWTTYTVARIRTAMGLPANHEQEGQVA